VKPDDHATREAMLRQINLLVVELNRIAASIRSGPAGQQLDLELMHERLSNLLSVMKADVKKLEQSPRRSNSASA
jgi:hypothetical protein